MERQLQQIITPGESPSPERLEPPIPFRALPWYDFHAHAPFDVICLARSPSFTPPAADRIFDAIREHFIDETAFEAPRPRRSRAW